MVDEYALGGMFSAIEYALPYALFASAAAAAIVFRTCRRKAPDEAELQRYYRSLSACAEVCGMLALFGIAAFFARSLIAHDKNVLVTARQDYTMQAHELAHRIQVEYCSYRDANGALAFRENLTPECGASDLRGSLESDRELVERKIAEIEGLSVLTGSTKLMLALDELKSELQGLAKTQLALASNHGPAAVTGPGSASVALLALALLSALFSASIKTGKACYEWHAGRRPPFST
jgi:hypothetical protein